MPEDEVPAAPFSFGRLSATENGLERVNRSLPTKSTSWGEVESRRPAACRKGMGRASGSVIVIGLVSIQNDKLLLLLLFDLIPTVPPSHRSSEAVMPHLLL